MNDDENSNQHTGPRSEGNLELFFDLVFTFAMSQVTQLMLHDLSPTGFGRAALALLAVWWAWWATRGSSTPSTRPTCGTKQ